MIHITREKRLDRVICKWGKYEIILDVENEVEIWDGYDWVFFPISEIPNLIKALTEVSREAK